MKFPLVIVVALGGCTANPALEANTSSSSGAERVDSNAAPPAATATAHDTSRSPYQARLLEIAKEYTAWGRVDDEMRWAPYLCRAPMPAQAYLSASKDDDTHGKKLYSLFAKDHRAYVEGASVAGQVVVKESWTPAPVSDPGAAPTRLGATVGAARPDGDHFHPYARTKDGQVFRAAERAGLFIMLKLDDTAPDTDAGWVYGTVTPRGEVTAAGRVASCMGCHVKAPRDRLFGLPGVSN